MMGLPWIQFVAQTREIQHIARWSGTLAGRAGPVVFAGEIITASWPGFFDFAVIALWRCRQCGRGKWRGSSRFSG